MGNSITQPLWLQVFSLFLYFSCPKYLTAAGKASVHLSQVRSGAFQYRFRGIEPSSSVFSIFFTTA